MIKVDILTVIVSARQRLRAQYQGSPLWVLVRDLCGLGSASAKQLCKELGLDPHQDCGEKLLRPPPSILCGEAAKRRAGE